MSLIRLRPAYVHLPARPPERACHNAVVLLLAQATRVPPNHSLIQRLGSQIVLLGLRDQNLRLLRQARYMSKARRAAARTPAHEALLCLPVEGLRADVARLAPGVLRALRDRDRDGLSVLLSCMVLLGAAAALDLRAEGPMAALPMQLLAVPPAIRRLADAALQSGVWERSGANGALREDHMSLRAAPICYLCILRLCKMAQDGACSIS